MKILYLCADLGIPVLGRKGASVHVRGLVAAFHRAGHTVILAAPILNKSPWETPANLGGSLLHLPPSAEAVAISIMLKGFNKTLGVENSLPGELRRILYNQELSAQIQRRFENDPPDFIYERASLYATAGVLAAKELNLPLLIEMNAPMALEQSTYRATGFGDLAAHAERYILSQADAVLPVSNLLSDYAVSLGVAPGKIDVIPNGVDPLLFHRAPPDPKVRRRWSLGEGPILGFVGGLKPWHGVKALPILIECLGKRHPNLKLVIAGHGPLRADLEREMAERGVAGQVLFTGALPHEEIADLVRLFDVALAPYTNSDHLFYFSPLKLFEYMACGVPVVAAGLGQIADVIQDGVTGLLYPPGDVEALTAACNRLLVDPPLRQHLGEAAAKEVQGKYTWDHNAARVANLTQSLIAARGRGR